MAGEKFCARVSQLGKLNLSEGIETYPTYRLIERNKRIRIRNE
jgi:hypothetical protein